jgi:hypothetical protein
LMETRQQFAEGPLDVTGSMQTSGVCSGLGRFLAHEMR